MLFRREQTEDYLLSVVGTNFMRMLQNWLTCDASEASPPTGFSFISSGFPTETASLFLVKSSPSPWECRNRRRLSLWFGRNLLVGFGWWWWPSAFYRASNLHGRCAVHLIPLWSLMEVVFADKTSLPLEFLLSGWVSDFDSNDKTIFFTLVFLISQVAVSNFAIIGQLVWRSPS